MLVRDCRVGNADTPDYTVVLDGELTIQNRMFSRASMSYWGFTLTDVTPPRGCIVEIWPPNGGEPVFTSVVSDEMKPWEQIAPDDRWACEEFCNLPENLFPTMQPFPPRYLTHGYSRTDSYCGTTFEEDKPDDS